VGTICRTWGCSARKPFPLAAHIISHALRVNRGSPHGERIGRTPPSSQVGAGAPYFRREPDSLAPRRRINNATVPVPSFPRGRRALRITPGAPRGPRKTDPPRLQRGCGGLKRQQLGRDILGCKSKPHGRGSSKDRRASSGAGKEHRGPEPGTRKGPRRRRSVASGPPSRFDGADSRSSHDDRASFHDGGGTTTGPLAAIHLKRRRRCRASRTSRSLSSLAGPAPLTRAAMPEQRLEYARREPAGPLRRWPSTQNRALTVFSIHRLARPS